MFQYTIKIFDSQQTQETKNVKEQDLQEGFGEGERGHLVIAEEEHGLSSDAVHGLVDSFRALREDILQETRSYFAVSFDEMKGQITQLKRTLSKHADEHVHISRWENVEEEVFDLSRLLKKTRKDTASIDRLKFLESKVSENEDVVVQLRKELESNNATILQMEDKFIACGIAMEQMRKESKRFD